MHIKRSRIVQNRNHVQINIFRKFFHQNTDISVSECAICNQPLKSTMQYNENDYSEKDVY